VAGAVAGPDDEVDLVLEVLLDPGEGGVDEGVRGVAVGRLGAVGAGVALAAVAGVVLVGRGVAFVELVGVEVCGGSAGAGPAVESVRRTGDMQEPALQSPGRRRRDVVVAGLEHMLAPR